MGARNGYKIPSARGILRSPMSVSTDVAISLCWVTNQHSDFSLQHTKARFLAALASCVRVSSALPALHFSALLSLLYSAARQCSLIAQAVHSFHFIRFMLLRCSAFGEVVFLQSFYDITTFLQLKVGIGASVVNLWSLNTCWF